MLLLEFLQLLHGSMAYKTLELSASYNGCTNQSLLWRVAGNMKWREHAESRMVTSGSNNELSHWASTQRSGCAWKLSLLGLKLHSLCQQPKTVLTAGGWVTTQCCHLSFRVCSCVSICYLWTVLSSKESLQNYSMCMWCNVCFLSSGLFRNLLGCWLVDCLLNT